MNIKFFRSWDFIIVIVIVLFNIFLLLAFNSNVNKNKISVFVEGVERYIFDTSIDGIYAIENKATPLMKLIIDGKEIHIVESNCKLKICEKHGSLKFYSDAIVCLPNKVIIKYKQVSESIFFDSDSEFDIMSK